MLRQYLTQKPDIALVPQALNDTNATGRYFDMSEFNEALVLLQGGAMAASKTTKVEIYQATDADGTDAELISGKAATVTANAAVTKATVALATVIAAQTVTINGVVFTAHASTTTKASREFSIAGNDTQDGDELAACINDATYGVPGVTAANSSGTITLTVTDPGTRTLTISASDSTVTIATVEAQAWVALKVEEMKCNDSFTHIAAKVTTTANTVVAATLLRTGSRFPIVDAVGASIT